jgi:hypothetical protein
VLLFILGEVAAVIAFFVLRAQIPVLMRTIWADMVSTVPQAVMNFEQLVHTYLGAGGGAFSVVASIGVSCEHQAQCCGYAQPGDLQPPNDNCSFTVGCSAQIENAVSRNILIVLLVAIGLVILQVRLGFVCDPDNF